MYKNKEDQIRQAKKWREENRQRYRDTQNRWSAKNREKKRECARNWTKRNPDKIKNTYLLREYGISLEEYNILYDEQNGLCAICEREQLGKSLAVDHCHNSGEIRGLLCEDCNRALGMFRDDTNVLYRAIKYLCESKKE